MASEAEILATVIRSWQMTRQLHEFREPTDVTKLARARWLGRPIPNAIQHVYGFSDGCRLFGGSVVIDTLDETLDRSIMDDLLLPEEIQLIGGDGGDELFSVLLLERDEESEWVVLAAEPLGGLAVAGSSVARFLRTWTAFRLVEAGGSTEALDALGVPQSLRLADDEGEIGPFLEWSDPRAFAFNPEPDPFESSSPLDEILAGL